jgi:hypothetical protein
MKKFRSLTNCPIYDLDRSMGGRSVGVSVHVVTVPGLTRTTVTTTIMGNAAIAI